MSYFLMIFYFHKKVYLFGNILMLEIITYTKE